MDLEIILLKVSFFVQQSTTAFEITYVEKIKFLIIISSITKYSYSEILYYILKAGVKL